MAAPDPIWLTAAEIAEVTGGRWIQPATDVATLRFSEVCCHPQRVGEASLFVSHAPEDWWKGIGRTDTPRLLRKARDRGAAGAFVRAAAPVLRSKRDLVGCGPLLSVESTKRALEKVAVETRKRFQGRAVLVTGTEGKTGCKLMLGHVLDRQGPCLAIRTSANLTPPIWCSLASIRPRDRFTVVEASVAQPNRGAMRSRYIRPHVCIVTELGPEHIEHHGSVENLVRNKSSVVEGLVEGGSVVANADTERFGDLAREVRRRRDVRIWTFGSAPGCDARLLDARFEGRAWQVRARIGPFDLGYRVGVVGEHVPLASLGPLLTAYVLGADVEQAARDLASFAPYITMGQLVEVPLPSGAFTFYDHSHRASVKSYRSAFKDLARLEARPGGRRIAVLGHMRELGPDNRPRHEELARLVSKARIERLYTVGANMRFTNAVLADPGVLVRHGETYKDIMDVLLVDIRPDDLVFMKGNHRLRLAELAVIVRSLGRPGPVDVSLAQCD